MEKKCNCLFFFFLFIKKTNEKKFKANILKNSKYITG